jgi:hypothetical protein
MIEKSKESNKKVNYTLQKEFYSLRKGEGITTLKLENLTLLPAIIAKAIGLPPQDTSIEQLHAYLIHEVNTLNKELEIMALRNAFGLEWEKPSTLTKRRLALASKLNKHVDTVEAYENRAIATLARRLISYDAQDVKTLPQAIEPSMPAHYFEGALRSLVSKGLGELLQVNTREMELLRCFSPNSQPYLDASVEWLFLPSTRGKDWYSNRIRYTFRRKKDYFRVAVTASSLDCEALMISGVVDEVIKLDRSPYDEFEMTDILQNTRFVVKETNGRQQLYAFTELSQAVTQHLLTPLWQIDKTDCRIIEVQIPKEKMSDETVFEYWLTYHIQLREQHAYWYSPSLMFLNNITLDISRFPDRKKWDFHILPFFGHVFPGTLESTGDRFTMPANSWIMQGHGIALTWQHKS